MLESSDKKVVSKTGLCWLLFNEAVKHESTIIAAWLEGRRFMLPTLHASRSELELPMGKSLLMKQQSKLWSFIYLFPNPFVIDRLGSG